MMSQCCTKCLTQCGPPPNRYIVSYLDQTKIGQSFNAEEHRCSDPPHNFVLVPMPRADPNLFAEFAKTICIAVFTVIVGTILDLFWTEETGLSIALSVESVLLYYFQNPLCLELFIFLFVFTTEKTVKEIFWPRMSY
eukprot:UN08299